MKYKVGDKVRIVDYRTELMNCEGAMDKWLGKVMTIREVTNHYYSMVEDDGEHFGVGWCWYENMIAGLVEPAEREDWTRHEIQDARMLVTDLACNAIYAGNSVEFTRNEDSQHNIINIECRIYKGILLTDGFGGYDSVKLGVAKVDSCDVFNEWVGKCVAICKVVSEPIPDFILNKNTR